MLLRHKSWKEIDDEEVIEPFVITVEPKWNKLNFLERVFKRFDDHVPQVNKKIE
jgi:hypothetical protein